MYPNFVKHIVNLVHPIRLLFCLVLMLLLGQQQAKAGYEDYIQTLTGKIKQGDTCRVTDDKYVQPDLWAKREIDLSVNNIITFEIRQDTNLYYYNKPFAATVTFNMEYEDASHVKHTLNNLQLAVNYDTAAGSSYKGVAMYKFEGGHTVKVTVVSISSPELGDENALPAIFRIRNQVLIERKYLFNATNSDITRYQLQNGKQLKLNWHTATDNYPGAEMYDLEWTFYDDSSAVATYIRSSNTPAQISSGEINLPQNKLEEYFVNNNTRITTYDREYKLNVIYPAGFIFYRVRGVRINPYTNEREQGDWTYNAYSPGNNTVSSVVYVTGHEPTLNYQYTAAFAEEGKRKEIVTYFDGSLKSRQTVTLNNSNNKSVVQETVYDVMGRPGVSILPSPEKDSTLHYFRLLNLNKNGQPYTYKDLSPDTAACVLAPQPMDSMSGTSRYYSIQNPHNEYFFNKYIPDAHGYPFTTTAYKNDNTGRISRQGGVGADFQPGTGHETRYFYGKPDQIELDRLFGSEAGNAQHYLKNMVLDPNGQVSVSYQDAHGRTIATALAGRKPDNLYGLSEADSTQTMTQVTKELANPENTERDAASFTVTSNSTLLIPMNGNYHFEYTYDPVSVLTASCVQDICSDCYYDLTITIKDECGESIYEKNLPASLNGMDTTCGTTAPLIKGSFDLDIAIGEYQVTYQLFASKAAADFYEEAFLRQNTCIKTLEDFKRQYIADVDFSGCYSECNTCKEALKDRDSFVDKFIQLIISEDMIPRTSDITFANNLYDSLYTACTQRCVNTFNTPCQDKYDLLVADITPGGQYAMYDQVALDDAAGNGEVLADQPVNVLAHYSEITDYKDENGQADQVLNDAGETVSPQQLTIREFIKQFKPSWAASLVKYHPEYCFYKWCQLTNSSQNFDDAVQNLVEDAKDAADNGWWNPSDPLALLKKDPFFMQDSIGRSKYTAMQTLLNNFGSTLQQNQEGVQANILQVVNFLIYCAKDTTRTTFSYAACTPPATCNEGRDENLEWQLYKIFYLQAKGPMVAAVRKTNSDPVIRDCKNCYIGTSQFECDPATNPDCGTMQDYGKVVKSCPLPDNDPTKPYYSKKVRQFMDDLDGSAIMSSYTSQTMAHLRDSLDQELNSKVASQCQSNCEAQADDWMRALQACHNLVVGTDSTKYKQLRQGLIDVCVNGCDASHPYGASTIAPGRPHTDSTFQDVIIRVLGQSALNDSCTALLIADPKPYEQDINMLPAGTDSCTCTKLNALKAEFEMSGGGGTFLNYLNRKYAPTLRLTQAQLDVLLKKCDPNACVSPSEMQFAVPEPFRCKTCVNCETLRTLVNTFRDDHPSLDTTSQRYETLLTNYLNQQLHFNLVYQEYWNFMQSRCYTNQDSYQPGISDLSCYEFSIAFDHFKKFKPVNYVNLNGDPNAATRFKNDLATWINLELNKNFSFNDYEAVADRCGITINVPQNVPAGDSVYSCFPVVLDCCTLETNIQLFRQAYPGGLNARLLAYYFEMQKHTWCTPIGVPDIDYNGDYQSLKNYFTNTFELPRDVIIDINETGAPVYTIRDSINCGINYNFGDGSPMLDGYVLCNRPVIIDLELDSTSCMRSQVELALSNAAGAYQQYMDSVRREYREIYLSRCLSAQPKLTMSGDLYEYHYTLYYYDQGDNLVKTIPPAGVRLLTVEDIAAVKKDRPYTTPECYKVTDTLNFDGGNINFGNLLASRNAYSFETWINVEYLDGQGFFSDAVTVTAPEKFIDSTRTIPAFTGRKGINFYGRDRYLEIELGQQPWYFPDTLYQTQYFTTSQPVDQLIGTGKWAHLVVMKTGNTASPFAIYVNGRAMQLSTTTRVDTLGGPPTAQGTPELMLGLAHMNEYDPGFYGAMKQLRFYNRPMVYKEIIANYTDSCFLPFDERGLEIWMPMNEGQGEVVTDRMSVRDYNLLPSADNFWWVHTHDPVYPQHELATNYQHNSLQGVVLQNTPDGGPSHFWYDRLGRIVASQNAEQASPVNGGVVNRYSYMKYDPINRVTEVGEKLGADNINLLESMNDNQVQTWLNSGTDLQVTHTQYDEPLLGLSIYQENLRKRIASATLDEDGDGTYETATHYSYDVLGNIKTLWQDIKPLESIASGQGLKRIDYIYDLISGNVNRIIYQPDQKDQFIYRFLYDADKRLINSGTSRDKLVWQQDATYNYYLHGPLARLELGESKVQGIDYAYTLQGWLKGINSAVLDVDKDMGKDGKQGTAFTFYGRDIYGYTLGYHAGDYEAIGRDSAAGYKTNFVYPSGLAVGNPLYNGNISNSTVALSKLNGGIPVGHSYGYDQLNRLIEARQHDISNDWMLLQDYKESISYDANGNFLQYLRNGTTQGGNQLSMDSFSYAYQAGTNRLRHVKDGVNAGYYSNDVDNQDDDNYEYDNIGNVIKDKASGITKIEWTISGKIKQTTQNNSPLQYGYDATGNRIWMDVNGQKTFYIRDAMGNVFGLYNTGNGGLSWNEQYLYGSTRLGVWQPAMQLTATVDPEKDSVRLGKRLYELSNHLGNVMATVSDKKIGVTSNNTTVDYYTADVRSQNDYYPFGMLQPGREYNLGGGYKYGFNGQEKSLEVNGNFYTAQFWEYDARIGRRWNTDPKPNISISPYNCFAGNPILFSDQRGDSIPTRFYDNSGKQTNDIPEMLQKAFNDEYGIKLGYANGKLYNAGSFKTNLKVSASAKAKWEGLLGSTNTAKSLFFGYKIGVANLVGGKLGAFASTQYGITSQNTNNAFLDFADFDAAGIPVDVKFPSGFDTRAFNFARVLEHEYLGHAVDQLKDEPNIPLPSLGQLNAGPNEQMLNKFRVEMNLPTRTTYGGPLSTPGDIGTIFTGAQKTNPAKYEVIVNLQSVKTNDNSIYFNASTGDEIK